MLLMGDLCALGGERVALAEGSGVFAEFGEGIEGASPKDSFLPERGKHGAYEDQGRIIRPRRITLAICVP